VSLQQVAEAMRQQYGEAFARRWLADQRHAGEKPAEVPESPPACFYEHPSHTAATELLEPHREALGAAYSTIHAIARWSIEHATERDPAPHLMTTYWTLEEMTGKCERTLRRHLIEDGHPWSETVSKLIDIRINYGSMLNGRDERGNEKERPVIIGMVIRFFSRTRYSPNAKVKRFGHRDLVADADEGRTRNSRLYEEKPRYTRQNARMSAYKSVKEQARDFNWLLVKLGQTVSNLVEQHKDCGKLYAAIPRNHLLNALRADLDIAVENAEERGANVKRARALWVDKAAQILAHRFGDDRPKSEFVPIPDQHVKPGGPIGWQQDGQGKAFPVYRDGFTNLWRRALWTALRAEIYGGTRQGWTLLEKMSGYAYEALQADKRKPTAWAWSLIKAEGFAELLRDYNKR
jgi:hypothetical protein